MSGTYRKSRTSKFQRSFALPKLSVASHCRRLKMTGRALVKDPPAMSLCDPRRSSPMAFPFRPTPPSAFRGPLGSRDLRFLVVQLPPLRAMIPLKALRPAISRTSSCSRPGIEHTTLASCIKAVSSFSKSSRLLLIRLLSASKLHQSLLKDL